MFQLILGAGAVVSAITGVLGFKVGQDTTPNPPILPSEKSSISGFEIGLLLIGGFLAVALVKMVGGLFK